MNIINNLDLSKKTTFKVGGTAKNFYIPSSADELLRLLDSIGEEDYFILSGGSNLLINDEKCFEHVISMEKADESMTSLGDGRFYIGASCRIQKVISFVNENQYGGFEGLYGLPALFGGNIYMNAGIGSKKNSKFTISDYIERVKCINRKKKEIVWLDKTQCGFAHRKSIFFDNEYIILGAEIKCVQQTIELSKEKIKQRLEYCRKNQVWGKGCFGTCFCDSNKKVLQIARVFRKFGNHGISVLKTNPNWIINNGNATFKETMKHINSCKRLHKLFHKKIELEVRIWN